MSFPAGRTDADIDRETDADNASAGRSFDHVLAVAIEPSRLAAGLVDAKGELLLRDRVTTPTRDVWRTLEQLIRRIIAAAPPGLPRPRAVGVSCVGPVDTRAGTVSPPLVPAWVNFPLREHLERLTGLEVELDSAGGAATEAET